MPCNVNWQELWEQLPHPNQMLVELVARRRHRRELVLLGEAPDTVAVQLVGEVAGRLKDALKVAASLASGAAIDKLDKPSYPSSSPQ